MTWCIYSHQFLNLSYQRQKNDARLLCIQIIAEKKRLLRRKSILISYCFGFDHRYD